MDVSDIFYFSARGGGRGSPRCQGGEVRFFIENPRGGGVSRREMGPRGREGVCGELGNWGGVIFFGGPKCPPSLSILSEFGENLKCLKFPVGGINVTGVSRTIQNKTIVLQTFFSSSKPPHHTKYLSSQSWSVGCLTSACQGT